MNEIIATNFKEFSSLLISNIDDELINHVILAFPEYLKMEKSRCRLEIACVTKDVSLVLFSLCLCARHTTYTLLAFGQDAIFE